MKKEFHFYYEKLSEWKDPEDVFVTLFGKKSHAFWLDSSRVEKGLSRFSYMGEATEIIEYSLRSSSQDIFAVLEEKLQILSVDRSEVPFDFVGGFVGYFGYELKTLCGFSSSYRSEYPDSLWFFVDRFLVFDHQEKAMYAACLSKKKENAEAWFATTKTRLEKVSPLPVKVLEKHKNISAHLARDKEKYMEDIHQCKEYLKNGESYEICLTNTITGEVSANPLDIYRVLRHINPAPYAAYIKHNNFAILCSSPERFLTIDQERRVESKPIKGTRKRGRDKKEDKKLAKQLLTSEKDRAENLMIVDLVRNDLGKVCEIGSVSVSKLMAIESYQTVHQLVSTIQGRLRKDMSVIDCIKACFPGGSMTGAPKKRTMEILERLEGKARGVYSGVLGFLSANGAVDLNIIIRTIVIDQDKFSIGAGGAIVSLSDLQDEYDEMLLKAQVLMRAFPSQLDQ